MPGRADQLTVGEYYHLYNRGNSKQIIFNDVQDYEYFEFLLSIMNTKERTQSRDKKKIIDKNLISIGAYCLMSNHFHILIKQEEDGGISIFMQKVSTAYAMYYNKKYKRTGSLFEGRFKSKHVAEDTYLKYLFAYIHLNPLKILDSQWKSKAEHMSKEMLKFLSEYKYSSFNECLSGVPVLLKKGAFPDYFPTKENFIKNITSWFIDEYK